MLHPAIVLFILFVCFILLFGVVLGLMMILIIGGADVLNEVSK